MRFLSAEWLVAWVQLCNSDEVFRTAGEGWNGVAGCVVRADPSRGLETLCLRLAGCDGQWTAYELGQDVALLDDALFVLTADYETWRAIVCQQLHPVRGMVLGKIRVRGQLSTVLRWVRPLERMIRLSGQLDTQFLDGADGAVP